MRASDLLLTVTILIGAGACETEVVEATGGSGPGGGGQGGSGAGAQEPPAYGSIRLSSSDFELDGGFHETSGRARASYRVSGTGLDGCETSGYGTCVVRDCDLTVMGLEEKLVDAGTVTITGGASPITLTSDAEGSYTEHDADALLFTGGESLVVDVAGKGDIPPHQLSVVAPSQVTTVEPPPDGYRIDRRVPFSQTWTGGGAGKVVITVVSYELGPDDQTERAVFVECSFDAPTGTGTIDAQLLALLPAGAGYTSVDAVSEQSAAAGAYPVTLRAQTNGVTPSGFSASTPATVE